jgi:hypothetical protein
MISVRGLLLMTTALVAGVAAPAASAHPPKLNPLAAVHYLEAQRAGYGSPAVAARLARKAEAQAAALRLAGAVGPIGPGSAKSISVPGPSGPSGLTGAWQALGPVQMTQSFYGGHNSGRVDGIAVVPAGVTGAGNIYVGTAGGGIWKSTDNGASWTTTTDQIATGLAIGAIAVDPTNGTTIYAGTGEANNCGDCFYGGGVLKSTDGGATWSVLNPTGVFTGVDFASIAVDPHNHTHLIAGTTSGWFVSTDSGVTWVHPTGAASTNAGYGLALDPSTTPTTIFIATVGVGIQKSTTGGASFGAAGGTGLPSSPGAFGVTQLGIGTNSVAHANADQTMYAAIQTQPVPNGAADLSMYKSTDGGGSWALVTTPPYTFQGCTCAYGPGNTGDQASYDNTIAVDPADPGHVLAAGIGMVETTNGGTSWSNVNGQSFFAATTASPNVLHPDFHALAFAPNGNVVIGNDGGVYEYSSGGAGGVTNLNNGLNTGQFYQDLGVYNNGAQILGGLQDNGTVLYTGSQNWPEVDSGDGGDSRINPLNPAQQFSQADQNLDTTTDGWTTSTTINPPGTFGNFTEPLTIVPNSGSVNAPTVYFGMANLWRTTNPAAGSPTWTKLTSIGSASNPVSAVAVAPSDPTVLYVGFNDGTLEVTTNATAPTPTFHSIPPPGGNYITHIDINPGDPSKIAVSFSSSNTHSASTPPMVETGAVTLTGTPSATYTNITGTGASKLPTGVASNSVVSIDGGYAVATDVGVFFTAAPSGTTTQWSALGTGLPNVQVIGLSVDATGDLFAATHGRGAWKLTNTSFIGPPTEQITTPQGGKTSYTLNQVVNAGYSCTAGANGTLKTGTTGCSGTVASGSPIDTSTAGTHPFTVTATQTDGQTTSMTVNYTVASGGGGGNPAGAPTAQITVPVDGSTLTQGSSVTASYACTAGSNGGVLATGSAGCAGSVSGTPVANGGPIDTSTIGSFSLTVTATDTDSQTATVTSHYTVQAASAGTSGTTGSTGGTGASGVTGITGTTGPVAAVATNISRPVVTGGTALPAVQLSCSTGTWSGNPTHFGFAWLRDGIPIAGATTSTYVVQVADDAHTLTCVVSAVNAQGSSQPAGSRGVFVGDLTALRCPQPTGSISGLSVGPLSLGMTQAAAKRALPLLMRSAGGFDDFCLHAGFGIRVAYGSQKSLQKLNRADRRRLDDKIVIALTANAFYAVGGVKPGATISSAGKRLHLGKPIQLGLNAWYFVSQKKATGVLKVRNGIVYEVGLADKTLTANPAAQKRLLRAFGVRTGPSPDAVAGARVAGALSKALRVM